MVEFSIGRNSKANLEEKTSRFHNIQYNNIIIALLGYSDVKLQSEQKSLKKYMINFTTTLMTSFKQN